VTAEEIQLNEVQLELLGLVASRKVLHTRGQYRLIATGMPAVNGAAIQVLRAHALVRLIRTAPGQRVPPNRMVELTDAGRALWEKLEQS
jgi:hypothetical protein